MGTDGKIYSVLLDKAYLSLEHGILLQKGGPNGHLLRSISKFICGQTPRDGQLTASLYENFVCWELITSLKQFQEALQE